MDRLVRAAVLSLALGSVFGGMAGGAVGCSGADSANAPQIQGVDAETTVPAWWDAQSTGGDAAVARDGDAASKPDSGAPPTCTSDGDCEGAFGELDGCASATCDVDAGVCLLSSLPVGTLCDDADPCTLDDRCEGGRCGGDPAACSDGNPCTDDGCQPGVGCVFTPNFVDTCDDGDPCTEGDRCVDGSCHGTPDPACACTTNADCARYDDDDLCNGVLSCQAGQCLVARGSAVLCPPSARACWVNACVPDLGRCEERQADDGTPCDDGDVCFVQTSCQAGSCVGAPLPCDAGVACAVGSCRSGLGCEYVPKDDLCDDENPCTSDACDVVTGCVYASIEGSCDDGDATTVDDRCVEGVCVGHGEGSCDDGNPCTADRVGPDGVCVYDAAGADGLPCDDGDAATQDDRCAAGTCRGSLIQCDDGDPCTLDTVDADSGACHHDAAGANGTPCDDGDVCSSGDACSAGRCVGTPITCDDGDICTTDSCEAGACVHENNRRPCDDGVACTTDDRCRDGVCVGDDSHCPDCTPTFSDAVVKLTSLLIGESGYVGQAMDIDFDSETCAPEGRCDGGRDNAMASVASLVNASLADAMASGAILYLMELPSWPPPPGTFSVDVYTNVTLAPEAQGCDVSGPGCVYEVSELDLDAECGARNHIDNVTWGGGVLSGGGLGSHMTLRWSLGGDAIIDLPLESVRIRCITEEAGGDWVRLRGIIGGAVPLDALESGILAIPPDQLPMPPEQLVGLLRGVLVADIDLDGDGLPDAASVGLPIDSVAAAASAAAGDCVPWCGNLECGPDPVCGVSCGTCAADESCVGGTCIGTGYGTCSELMSCANACGTDPACSLACFEATSQEGREYWGVMAGCVDQNCPDGGEACYWSECGDEIRDCLRH